MVARSAVSFQGLERRSVTTADRAGIKTIHEGGPLRDVLAKANWHRSVPELRGKALARAVVATAVHGYQAAYAIAESIPPSTITWC